MLIFNVLIILYLANNSVEIFEHQRNRKKDNLIPILIKNNAALSFATQHAIPREFNGKWGTEVF